MLQQSGPTFSKVSLVGFGIGGTKRVNELGPYLKRALRIRLFNFAL
jgi:hypothetical protein